MTTAYGNKSTRCEGMGDKHAHMLPWIPAQAKLRDGQPVKIQFIHSADDVETVHRMLNVCIEDGNSWPFDQKLSEEEFRAYFFAHTAIVLRSDSNEIIGAFYCKPNFPGRCDHFCNGGFITEPRWRRRGIAQLMAIVFLRVAKSLKFEASLFNLVFEYNVASINLWEKLGFTRVGTLPGVVRLDNGKGFKDAYQYYSKVSTLDDRKLADLINNDGHQHLATSVFKLVSDSEFPNLQKQSKTK